MEIMKVGQANMSSNEGFQREIYLPSASYYKGNMEKRLRDVEKNIDKNESSPSNDEEKPTIPKLVRHFFGYTTAHGMSRLADSKGLFWKIFWSLICLGSFGMFTYQAHGLFNIYFSRPITTSVRITFEKQVAFPAVTICNLNILRNTEIPNTLKEALANEYETYNTSQDLDKARSRRGLRRKKDKISSTRLPFLRTSTAYGTYTVAKTTLSDTSTFAQATTSPSLTSYSDHQTKYNSITTPYNTYYTKYNPRYTKYNPHYTKYNPYYKPYYPKYYDDNDYYKYRSRNYKNYKYYDNEYLPPKDEVDQNTLFLERFTTFVTHFSEAQLSKAGHQFEDLVTNCTWRGFECKKGNYSQWWYQSWNYKYGNCYTFNGGKDENNEPIRVLSTSKPGPNQGLSLRLDIEQDEYLSSISSEAGVRVILHDQGVMPFPFLEGFSVSPGMSTSVGIQKTVIARVDRFGNNTCWDINSLDEKNIYRIHYNITKYTQQTCQNSCLGATQFEECGCSEYTYPSGSPACDTFNDTLRDCLWEVYLKFNNDILACMKECRQPCSENIIQKTISMSQWPSAKYENYERKRSKNFSSKSALLLNIFYNQLNYQRIEESFVYDEINLLADIGGQLGLWIGVSVITCFEVLELFMLIAVRLVRNFQRKESTEVGTLP